LGGEEESPEGEREGGRFGFEETGQGDLDFTGVGGLAKGGRVKVERESFSNERREREREERRERERAELSLNDSRRSLDLREVPSVQYTKVSQLEKSDSQ